MSSYSYPNYDIDLHKLESTDDPTELVNECKRVVWADSDFKIYPARQWIENFLYYAGNQYAYSRAGSGTVVGTTLLSQIASSGSDRARVGPARKRRIPKLFKAVQVQAANITRQRPSVKVWPEDESEIADKKAKLSNILLDYSWDPDCEDALNYEALIWALLSPAVGRKDSLDFEFNLGRMYPQMETAVDPNSGSPIIDPNTGRPVERPMMNANGKPVLIQLPWNKTELIPAFRLFFNPSASWSTSIDFVGDISIKRLQWVEQNYAKRGKGYHHENLDNVKKGQWIFTPIMAMEHALKQLTFGAFRGARSTAYNSSMVKDGVTTVNLFVKPSPNYPYGREIVVANGELLYDGDSRVYRETPLNWHPYSFLCYERVPGRLWGTTYGEKLTDINRSYEQSRAEMDQLRRTFTKPKMLLPTGASLDRDTITGEEQIFRYNPFAADGGKPSFIQPPSAGNTLLDDIKLTGQEFVEISGVTEIMQGIRPQGVTTYRGLEVLREEANNAASNQIRMYESFVQNCQINKLENIRTALIYPDKNLQNAMRIFKRMNKYITDIDIDEFVGSSLGGYVKVEPMSSIAKSRLGQQEKIMSLVQSGALGDVVNDPELNSELKRKMDVTGFDPPSNRQVNYARWENQLMLSADERQTLINPTVYPWHDDIIHIREIENLLLDPVIQSKTVVFQSLLAHRQAHQQQKAQKDAQMLQQQTMLQGMAGGQPQPTNPLNKPSNSGNLQMKGDQGMLFGTETGFGGGEIPNQV